MALAEIHKSQVQGVKFWKNFRKKLLPASSAEARRAAAQLSLRHLPLYLQKDIGLFND